MGKLPAVTEDNVYTIGLLSQKVSSLARIIHGRGSRMQYSLDSK